MFAILMMMEEMTSANAMLWIHKKQQAYVHSCTAQIMTINISVLTFLQCS